MRKAGQLLAERNLKKNLHPDLARTNLKSSFFYLFFVFLSLNSQLYAAKDHSRKMKIPEEKRFSPEVEYLTGRFKASRNASFRKVKPQYTDGTSQYLLTDVAEAFENMAAAAKKEKIKLFVVSGFRSFTRQKRIWEEKFLGYSLVENKNLREVFRDQPEKRVALILKYFAIPGTSRHHWGTDFDLNCVSPLYYTSGEGLKIYEWLKMHAKEFGFFQPYSAIRTQGYHEEPWHWSSKKKSEALLKRYLQTITPEAIKGFEGDAYLPADFLDEYVSGISHE
jgi:zinc D-Ala-D-Ala carboxypeptidase